MSSRPVPFRWVQLEALVRISSSFNGRIFPENRLHDAYDWRVSKLQECRVHLVVCRVTLLSLIISAICLRQCDQDVEAYLEVTYYHLQRTKTATAVGFPSSWHHDG